MHTAAGPSSGAAVEVRGVSKQYGALGVLEDLDLSIAAGEIVSILGPSGCGKTTLLRTIGGLEPLSAGSITIDDTTPEVARRAKRIAVVPQAPALMPWRTVAANARLLLDVNRRANPSTTPDPAALLTEVGLGEFLDALPEELSGGMRQRVALVRALALGAPLLLLDEPFAALDEITRADMRHLLARLCEQAGATVVLVTHSIAEAVFLADRVVVLSQRPGRILHVEPVGFDRPRRRELEDRPEFFAILTRLRHLIAEDAERARRGER